jgi:hypothetical protein
MLTNKRKSNSGYSFEEMNAVIYSKEDRRSSECNVQNILNTSPALCDVLITRQEKSCRLWCVVVCVLETS